MKLKKVIFTAAAGMLIVYSCKTSQKLVTEPGDKELAVAQQKWPGTTLAQLKEGEGIYKNECTQCHKNFAITKFTEKKWLHEIDDMSPKAKLNADQKEKLTRYILSFREANQVQK